jgi:NAD(P)-dependent dehydrogenase (short-subunit alcohol dehydrogenase family)
VLYLDFTMKTLKNKLVAITGAASGMGRALALHCAALGSRLAIADVDVPGVEATADRARQAGAEVDVIRLDVADRAAIHAWAARVAEKSGGADVLINNAGVSLSHSIEKMKDEDFEWLFNINFWGVANGCKAFLPQLKSRPEAHIVNMSSVFGIIGVPTQAAYCAAKFAVRGYTETLRQELLDTKVGVTCVHPGGIKTEIARRGRHYEDALGGATSAERAAAEFERQARTTAEEAASAIAAAVLKNDPRLLIGADAVAIDVIARAAPVGYTRLVRRMMRRAARH